MFQIGCTCLALSLLLKPMICATKSWEYFFPASISFSRSACPNGPAARGPRPSFTICKPITTPRDTPDAIIWDMSGTISCARGWAPLSGCPSRGCGYNVISIRHCIQSSKTGSSVIAGLSSSATLLSVLAGSACAAIMHQSKTSCHSPASPSCELFS